jgi:hypothetical protein
MLHPRTADRIHPMDEFRTNTIKSVNRELFNILQKVTYTYIYGTKEHGAGYPARIYTVSDAAESLQELLRRPTVVDKHERHYAGKTKLGDMHIYSDAGRASEFHVFSP